MVSKAMVSNQSLYDRDFYAWATEQASLLRAGRLAEADIPNIAEEIESMGRGEKRELVSRLTVLLVHLLKWGFQQEFRSRSWQSTIKEQRRKVIRHLGENPSLKPQMMECIADAFESALVEIGVQTGIGEKFLPKSCPWTSEQLLDGEWFPE